MQSSGENEPGPVNIDWGSLRFAWRGAFYFNIHFEYPVGSNSFTHV